MIEFSYLTRNVGFRRDLITSCDCILLSISLFSDASYLNDKSRLNGRSVGKIQNNNYSILISFML